LTQIAYRDVAPPPSAAPDVPPALRPADGAQAAKALGGHVLTPAWVPKGYSLRGAFVRDCTRCADMQTVVLRYGDGTGAVSIFEGRADAPCRRGAGDASCCATSSGALTTTRTVEGIKATAVASGLDARTLERVANSLRTADAP
jgi:hypothetical protein